MRLKDADKLVVDARLGEDEIPYMSKAQIDEAPTVEAIPIEWLKDQIRAIPCDKVYFMQPKDVIENLIIQWRWEQEKENANR